MRAYVMDAFADRVFGGNQAGVALPDRPLEDAVMQQIAAEFKHSETAFVAVNGDGSVTLRYFTPAGEVDLCGHATVASFALLRQEGLIGDGSRIAHTKAADLNIEVSGGTVWMDMAPPQLIRKLTAEEWSELYAAYGLTTDDRPEGLEPWIVSTGLADIMMPVRDHDTLMRAVQNEAAVTELSIPEECATGTSNGALTYYLYLHGMVRPLEENTFLQGEHMRRPSVIRSRLYDEGGTVNVRIGGSAVMSMSCDIKL